MRTAPGIMRLVAGLVGEHARAREGEQIVADALLVRIVRE